MIAVTRERCPQKNRIQFARPHRARHHGNNSRCTGRPQCRCRNYRHSRSYRHIHPRWDSPRRTPGLRTRRCLPWRGPWRGRTARRARGRRERASCWFLGLHLRRVDSFRNAARRRPNFALWRSPRPLGPPSRGDGASPRRRGAFNQGCPSDFVLFSRQQGDHARRGANPQWWSYRIA